MPEKGNRIDRLRKDIKALRKNYTGVLAAANKAVYRGMGQLAEHELRAIRTHYREALTGLKALRKGGAPSEVATVQLQLLQNTADRMLNNARTSLAILNGTRRELGLQIRRNLDEQRETDANAQSATSARSTASTASGSRKTTARKRPARKTAAGRTAATSDTPGRTPPSRGSGTRTKASTAKRRSGQKTTSRRSSATDSDANTTPAPASEHKRESTQSSPADTPGDNHNER